MSVLDWAPLHEEDLPLLMALAGACLDKDGGLPLLETEPLLRTLFYSGPNIGGRDETGDLVAVAAMFRDDRGQLTATGLVHPSSRRLGYGEQLVAWVREQVGDAPVNVVAETTSPESNTLFAADGLTCSFAETVMRHNLKHIPFIRLPDGITTEPFSAQTAPAFDEAYRRSFGGRPGYTDDGARKWLGSLGDDPDFRAEESRVALDQAGEPVGFVAVSTDWIDFVGVVPEWRGRALGAHLVVRSLRALHQAGSKRVWLCVRVDNPARGLYERLGFKVKGTRARYVDRVATQRP